MTVEMLMAEMEAAGVKPVDAAFIRRQLNDGMPAILTRDFVCGLRASVERPKKEKIAKIWTTNSLENPDHPISQQFRFRKFSFA